MNELESKSSPAVDSLQSDQPYAALQTRMTILLLAMVVLSGTLTVYLYQQQRYAVQDRDVTKQAVTQLLQAFQQQQKPLMENFLGKLQDYGKTHPNFVPLLTKYGYTGQTAVVTAPAPAAGIPQTAPAVPPQK
ncbi:MAG: hypothetical protein IH623_20085 [Verrucomicrobia bacterium]|nr:hypothetical protein [Verrucomicrobiota bacterium]